MIESGSSSSNSDTILDFLEEERHPFMLPRSFVTQRAITQQKENNCSSSSSSRRELLNISYVEGEHQKEPAYEGDHQKQLDNQGG